MIAEIITLFIMATALGMDAFSVSLGMGMAGLRYRQILHIGLMIGAFHVLMPLLGILFGRLLSEHLGNVAAFVGGGLLLLIGVQMIWSSIKGDEDESSLSPVGFGLIICALSVSLDSFSVGLGLGMLGAKTLITVAAMGLMSMILSWLGLILGKRLGTVIGGYGELLGGFILLFFGIKLLLPL